jgi:hypothetical protein
LAAELLRPGLDHLNLFQNVKEAVLAATGGAQQPWESNGIDRRVYLTGLPKPIEPTKDPTPAQSPQISEAERTWPVVKDTTSIAVLEAFVERYKDTIYGELARARIGELKRQLQQQEDEKKRAEAETAKKSERASPEICGGNHVELEHYRNMGHELPPTHLVIKMLISASSL